MVRNCRIVLLIAVVVVMLAITSCAGNLALNVNPPPGSSGEITREENNLIRTEEIVISLLLLAALVSLATQRLRIPYTVGLVLVGFGLTLFGQIPVVPVLPDIILALLVPPLVFEAAFHLNYSDLRRNLPVILALAVPGVIMTTLLVGGLVSFAAGISLTTALVFGALIAATDPVAVVALFRTIGAPKRLQVLLEGESLLNDGTAIVLFNIMVAVALTGHFDLGASILQFVIVAGGGILVGVIAGVIVSQVIGQIDNYLVETTLTSVLVYGSYLIAEHLLGVSGVLAVVAAGLASGQIGPKGMSPTTRIVVFNFWEYAAFLANSFVFLIIGLQMDFTLLVKNGPAIGWAILAVLAARAVTVYGLSWIGQPIPLKWKNVLFWGGLRGAISLALALSLNIDLPDRDQLQAMAFGVVLFTLVVEGLTMKPLINRSGIIQTSATRLEYEKRHGRVIALHASQNHLRQLKREGLISEVSWRIIKPILDERSITLTNLLRETLEKEPVLHNEELADAFREAIRSQRSALTDLFRDNIITQETFETLIAEVDALLIDPESTWSELAEVLKKTDDHSVVSE